MTKEEFVNDLKEAVANPTSRAKYEAAKLEFEGLIEKVRPFDPILCEHLDELYRVAVKAEKYMTTFYKK